MKFTLDESEKTSRKWMNDRWMVCIQKTAGEKSDTYVVYVAVDDARNGAYDPIYPRFEGHGLNHMAPVAEALVRHMARLKEDAPLSAVEKILKTVRERLYQAYAEYKLTQSTEAFKKLGIDVTDKPEGPQLYRGGAG